MKHVYKTWHGELGNAEAERPLTNVTLTYADFRSRNKKKMLRNKVLKYHQFT